jgi:hypothetical protein
MFQAIHFNSKGRATTNASKPEVLEKLKQIVGAGKCYNPIEKLRKDEIVLDN